MDQRGRDAAPLFLVPLHFQDGKYHALLIDKQKVTYPSIEGKTEVTEKNQTRTVPIDTQVTRTFERGIYSFRTVEERDKFIKLLNNASGIDEYSIAIAVTVREV